MVLNAKIRVLICFVFISKVFYGQATCDIYRNLLDSFKIHRYENILVVDKTQEINFDKLLDFVLPKDLEVIKKIKSVYKEGGNVLDDYDEFERCLNFPHSKISMGEFQSLRDSLVLSKREQRTLRKMQRVLTRQLDATSQGELSLQQSLRYNRKAFTPKVLATLDKINYRRRLLIVYHPSIAYLGYRLDVVSVLTNGLVAYRYELN